MNLLTVRILWGALLFSSLLYGFALYFVISQQGDEYASPMDPQLLKGLGLAAAISLITAIMLPRLLWSKINVGQGVRAPMITEEMVMPHLQSFFTPFIIRLALIESVAMFGFAMSFLSRDMNYYYALEAVAVMAMLANFPSVNFIAKTIKLRT